MVRISAPVRHVLPRSRSGLPAQLLLTVAVVCGGLAALPASSVAEGSDLISGGLVSSDWTTPLSSVPGTSREGVAQFQELAREQEAAEKAEEERLASPAARAERDASRTAHGDLPDAAALELLRGEFSPILRSPIPDTETLVGGDKIAAFIGDSAMRIEGRDGRPNRLIDSQVALRVTDDNGVKQPTDFDWTRAGDQYEPETAGPDVAASVDMADGVEVGPLRVTPAGDAEAKILDADTIAYPNSEVDTDLAVNTTPNGIETFHQLRSPDAPESLHMRLNVPSDAALRTNESGGAEVVRGGQTLATAQAPLAVDAQGKDVPVSFEIDGNVLKIKVAHRSMDVAYPLLVDPTFELVTENWAGYGPVGSPGAYTDTWFHDRPVKGLQYWVWNTNYNSIYSGYGTDHYARDTHCVNVASWGLNNCFGPAHGGGTNWNLGSGGRSVGETGLHINIRPNLGYANFSLGQWLYHPPGTTTRIYRADFGVKFLRKKSANNYPLMYTGVWSYPDNNWATLEGHPGGAISEDSYGGLTHNWSALWASTRPGPQAVSFGFSNFSGATQSVPAWRTGYMGGAIIQLTDPEGATATSAQLSSDSTSGASWTADGTYKIDAQGTDPGLGVAGFEVTAPIAGGTTKWDFWSPGCPGTRTSPCPATSPTTRLTAILGRDANPQAAGTQPLREGTNSIEVRAFDALGQVGAAKTIAVKVDRTGPTPGVSGALHDTLDGQWVADGSYPVNVNAQDSYSGVKSLALSIDGIQVGPTIPAPSQSSGAGLSHTFNVDTTGLKYGRHDITVTAIDWTGNRSDENWRILADGRETTFKLSPGATLAEIQSISSAGDEVLSLTDTRSGDKAGGYAVDGEEISSALSSYREDYQETEGPGTEPQIAELVFGGSVPTASLGSLAAKVASREELNRSSLPPLETEPDEEEPASLLEYIDSLFNADVAAEAQEIDPRTDDDPEPQAAAQRKKFAPQYGSSHMFVRNVGERTQRIHHTFTWTADNWQGEFDNTFPIPQDAYEHDFKLKNYSNPGSFWNRHPGCGDSSQNFWAVLKGKSWFATGKDVSDGDPYFDSANATDSCRELDFTVGFYSPRNLKTGRKYGSIIRARPGNTSSSIYHVVAQRSTKDCPLHRPGCIAPLGRGGEKKKLIPSGTVPDCRRWRQGRGNRPC